MAARSLQHDYYQLAGFYYLAARSGRHSFLNLAARSGRRDSITLQHAVAGTTTSQQHVVAHGYFYAHRLLLMLLLAGRHGFYFWQARLLLGSTQSQTQQQLPGRHGYYFSAARSGSHRSYTAALDERHSFLNLAARSRSCGHFLLAGTATTRWLLLDGYYSAARRHMLFDAWRSERAERGGRLGA